MFLPGNEVLAPMNDPIMDTAWAAYNRGDETWSEWLQANEANFTAPAFQKLCAVVPSEPRFDRSNVIQLPRLPPPAAVEAASDPQTAAVRQMLGMIQEMQDLIAQLPDDGSDTAA